MKKTILILAIPLLCYYGISQENQREYSLPQFIDISTVNQFGSGSISIFIANPEKPYVGFKGNPYLDENFIEGVMVVDDTIRVRNFPLRYNLFKQNMEFISKDEIYYIINPFRVNYLEFDKKKFLYICYADKGDDFNGYFEVLEEGKCDLYRRYTCRLEEGYYNKALSAGDRSYKYVKFEHYYMSKDNEPAVKIKAKKGSLFKIMTENKDEIDNYIKENKLKLSKEEDLIKLVNYYNSLHH